MVKELPENKLLRLAITDFQSFIQSYVKGTITLTTFRSKMIQAIEPFYSKNFSNVDLKSSEWNLLGKYKGLVFDKGGDKFEASTDPFPKKTNWIYSAQHGNT